MQHPPRNPARHLAARMGHWSASHRKLAIFGWLAFVVVAIVIGTAVGTKTIDRATTTPSARLRGRTRSLSTGGSSSLVPSPRSRSSRAST